MGIEEKERMENENGLLPMVGSLPVANVQALAAQKLDEVPQKYIRPELQDAEFCVDWQLEIPVIDLSTLSPEFSEDELKKLDMACQEWGFFQLINHGVSHELIEKMKEEVQNFFMLPLEEKKAYSQLPNNIEGYGQAFVVSEDQKLDWGDMLFLLPRPVRRRNMKLWPTNPTTFREVLDKYSSELQRVAMCLVGLMAKNLGADPKKLTDMFKDGTQGVRMNYYPPCEEADKVLGLSPHSDATGITLLVQAKEVQGLQIKKNGKWVPVKPVPNAFIVNVGDIVEILSNGRYKSIEHRAVINKDKERLSIAAFHSPSLDAKIGPLEEVVGDGKAHYRSVSVPEFVMLVATRKLDGKKLMDDLKLCS